jgi:hypothetical protein
MHAVVRLRSVTAATLRPHRRSDHHHRTATLPTGRNPHTEVGRLAGFQSSLGGATGRPGRACEEVRSKQGDSDVICGREAIRGDSQARIRSASTIISAREHDGVAIVPSTSARVRELPDGTRAAPMVNFHGDEARVPLFSIL